MNNRRVSLNIYDFPMNNPAFQTKNIAVSAKKYDNKTITQKLSELSGEDLQLRDQRSLTGIMALDLEENLFEKFDLSKIIAPIKGVFRLFVETIKFAPIRITTAL